MQRALLFALALAVAAPAHAANLWLTPNCRAPATMSIGVKFPAPGCYATESLTGPNGETFTVTRNLAAYYTLADGSLAQCGANELRVSHEGPVFEAAATNRLLWSNDLTNAAWTKRAGATVTTDATLCPDGTTASKAASVTGAGGNDIYQTAGGFTGGAALQASLWLKRVSTSGTLRIENAQSGDTGGRISVDLAAIGTGWTRVIAGATGVTVDTGFTADGGGTSGMIFYAPSGTLSFYVCGTMLHAGTAPTSLIITEGAAVTRPADSVSFSNP